MAKIHVLEKTLRGEAPNRTGTVTALYHINLSGGVTVNTAVPVSQEGGYAIDVSDLVAGRVRGAQMLLGSSQQPTLTTTHPDFGATSEATLLANQDIAEIIISYQINENDSVTAIATALDALYATIQAKARTRYTELLQFYGTERNPA